MTYIVLNCDVAPVDDGPSMGGLGIIYFVMVKNSTSLELFSSRKKQIFNLFNPFFLDLISVKISHVCTAYWSDF